MEDKVLHVDHDGYICYKNDNVFWTLHHNGWEAFFGSEDEPIYSTDEYTFPTDKDFAEVAELIKDKLKMSFAYITEEKTALEEDADSDGTFNYIVMKGTITYSCCGWIEKNASTYMGDGDSNKCPKCENPIIYTREKRDIQSDEKEL